MVLQFNPPTDLINAYMNRPNPGLQIIDGLNSVAQSYLKQKDDQKKEDLAQQAKDVEMAKALAGGGQDFTDAYKQIVAARNAPPVGGPPSSIPTNQGPSLIDRAKTFFNMAPVGKSPIQDIPTQDTSPGAAKAGLDGVTSVPPPPTPSTGTVSGILPTAPSYAPPPMPVVGQGILNPDGTMNDAARSAYIQQHGQNGWDRYMKSIAEQNTLQAAKARTQKQPVMTKEDALAAGSVEPNARIVEPPAPKDGEKAGRLLDSQLKDAQAAYNHDKSIEKSQAVVDKISQATPLLQAGTLDNATAKQALVTAMTYMATGGMRVNQTELQQMGGAQTLTNKFGKWMKGINDGTLTPRDAQDMGKVLDIFQQSAQKNLQDSGLRHVRQYKARSNSTENDADAYKAVTGLDFSPEHNAPQGTWGIVRKN